MIYYEKIIKTVEEKTATALEMSAQKTEKRKEKKKTKEKRISKNL